MTKTLQRILLVEDDQDIATLATMALSELGGFDVIHYFSGADALAAIESDAPDLVLLDFSMPGMKGDEIIEALKSDDRTRHLPVLFMTASVMPSHVARLMELGAIDVLKKPFDPLTLSDKVREAWTKGTS